MHQSSPMIATALLILLTSPTRVRTRTVAERLSVSDREARRVLSQLARWGLVVRVGEDHMAYSWKIVSMEDALQRMLVVARSEYGNRRGARVASQAAQSSREGT